MKLPRLDTRSISRSEVAKGVHDEEAPPSPSEYVAAIAPRLQGRRLELLVEPGRAIAAEAGLLLARVEYLKLGAHRNFAVVDTAMNDLLRPALYNAWQDILPVDRQPQHGGDALLFDVVGPVCESADFLGKNRRLAIAAGDIVAVTSAGAYGFVMSSNYNTRPRAAEIMVDGDAFHLVRAREQVRDLFAGESRLPD